MSKMTVRISIFVVGAILLFFAFRYYYRLISMQQDPIKIGILHSMTGTMASAEMPVIDAFLLAIEEINERGGVLGRYIEPVIVDGASDPQVFAKMAEELITHYNVVAIFGCWLSAAEKSVKKVVEKYNNLLFYPLGTEGLELSPNVFYFGETANQVALPAVEWAVNKFGERVFIAEVNLLYSKTISVLVRKKIELLGGEIVGQAVIEPGSNDVEAIVQNIQKTKPDFIVNLLDTSICVPFFTLLRKAGITPDTIPNVGLLIGEQETIEIGPHLLVGDYVAWTYFQTLDIPKNHQFIDVFRSKYGVNRLITSPLVAAYSALHVWAQAVEAVKVTDPVRVRIAVKQQRFDSPEGRVYVDFDTQYTWKIGRVGKIRQDGLIDVVWDTGEPVQPQPYPLYETREAWDRMLENWYKEWGNQWIKT